MGLMRDRKLEDEYAKIFDDLGFDIDVKKKIKRYKNSKKKSKKNRVIELEVEKGL